MLDTYRGGYTKALLDVKEFFEQYSESLAYRKVVTKKGIKNLSAIIDGMIEYRDVLMKWGEHADCIMTPEGKFIFREP